MDAAGYLLSGLAPLAIRAADLWTTCYGPATPPTTLFDLEVEHVECAESDDTILIDHSAPLRQPGVLAASASGLSNSCLIPEHHIAQISGSTLEDASVAAQLLHPAAARSANPVHANGRVIPASDAHALTGDAPTAMELPLPGGWLRADFTAERLISGYELCVGWDGLAPAAGHPTAWELEGSPDGHTWHTLDSRQCVRFPAPATTPMALAGAEEPVGASRKAAAAATIGGGGPASTLSCLLHRPTWCRSVRLRVHAVGASTGSMSGATKGDARLQLRGCRFLVPRAARCPSASGSCGFGGGGGLATESGADDTLLLAQPGAAPAMHGIATAETRDASSGDVALGIGPKQRAVAAPVLAVGWRLLLSGPPGQRRLRFVTTDRRTDFSVVCPLIAAGRRYRVTVGVRCGIPVLSGGGLLEVAILVDGRPCDLVGTHRLHTHPHAAAAVEGSGGLAPCACSHAAAMPTTAWETVYPGPITLEAPDVVTIGGPRFAAAALEPPLRAQAAGWLGGLPLCCNAAAAVPAVASQGSTIAHSTRQLSHPHSEVDSAPIASCQLCSAVAALPHNLVGEGALAFDRPAFPASSLRCLKGTVSRLRMTRLTGPPSAHTDGSGGHVALGLSDARSSLRAATGLATTAPAPAGSLLDALLSWAEDAPASPTRAGSTPSPAAERRGPSGPPPHRILATPLRSLEHVLRWNPNPRADCELRASVPWLVRPGLREPAGGSDSLRAAGGGARSAQPSVRSGRPEERVEATAPHCSPEVEEEEEAEWDQDSIRPRLLLCHDCGTSVYKEDAFVHRYHNPPAPVTGAACSAAGAREPLERVAGALLSVGPANASPLQAAAASLPWASSDCCSGGLAATRCKESEMPASPAGEALDAAVEADAEVSALVGQMQRQEAAAAGETRRASLSERGAGKAAGAFATQSEPGSVGSGKHLPRSSPQAVTANDPIGHGYLFDRWQYCDVFVYFSHERVTIPPRGWIDAAHRSGVKVLGTLITEWTDGAKANELLCGPYLPASVLCSGARGGHGRAASAALPAKGPVSVAAAVEDSDIEAPTLASQLAAIAAFFGFDGWLVNIEAPCSSVVAAEARPDFVNVSETNEVAASSRMERPSSDPSAPSLHPTPAHAGARAMRNFVADLTQHVRKAVGPHGRVIWYDSVCASSGRVRWQSALTPENAPFLAACDGLFLDYHWTPEMVQETYAAAAATAQAPLHGQGLVNCAFSRTNPSCAGDATEGAGEPVAPACCDAGSASGGASAADQVTGGMAAAVTPCTRPADTAAAATAAGKAGEQFDKARGRVRDVFVGIDVWGRGTYGGGGWGCRSAVDAILQAGTDSTGRLRQRPADAAERAACWTTAAEAPVAELASLTSNLPPPPLSIALFGPAWSYEAQGGASDAQLQASLDARLWEGQGPMLPADATVANINGGSRSAAEQLLGANAAFCPVVVNPSGEADTPVSAVRSAVQPLPSVSLTPEATGPLRGWTVVETGGAGWAVEQLSGGNAPEAGISSCFVTSHRWCRASQTVLLLPTPPAGVAAARAEIVITAPLQPSAAVESGAVVAALAVVADGSCTPIPPHATASLLDGTAGACEGAATSSADGVITPNRNSPTLPDSITVSEWYCGTGPNFSDSYYLKAQLVDAAGAPVHWLGCVASVAGRTGADGGSIMEGREATAREASGDSAATANADAVCTCGCNFDSGVITTTSTWRRVAHTFGRLPPRTAGVRIEHGGKDAEVWAGHFGARMCGASVTIPRSPAVAAALCLVGMAARSPAPTPASVGTSGEFTGRRLCSHGTERLATGTSCSCSAELRELQTCVSRHALGAGCLTESDTASHVRPLLSSRTLPFSTTFNTGRGAHWYAVGAVACAGAWLSVGEMQPQPSFRGMWATAGLRHVGGPLTVSTRSDGSLLVLPRPQRVNIIRADASARFASSLHAWATHKLALEGGACLQIAGRIPLSPSNPVDACPRTDPAGDREIAAHAHPASPRVDAGSVSGFALVRLFGAALFAPSTAPLQCGYAASAEPVEADSDLWVRFTYNAAAAAATRGVSPAMVASPHDPRAVASAASSATLGAVAPQAPVGARTVIALPVPVWQLQEDTHLASELRLLWPASLTDEEAPEGRGWRVLRASFSTPAHAAALAAAAHAAPVAPRDTLPRTQSHTEPSSQAGRLALTLKALCVAVCVHTPMCDAAPPSVVAANSHASTARTVPAAAVVPGAALRVVSTSPASAAPQTAEALAATALAIGRLECWRGGKG